MAAGGVAGFDGSVGSNLGGLGGGEILAQCSTPADCLQLPSACVYATCISGGCGFADVAKGAFVDPDPPGDCHHYQCDGAGNAVPVIDVSDVPVSEKPCFTNVCDPVTGNTQAMPVAAGTDCSNAAGGTRCDNLGNCVDCLDATDCASGKVCSALNTCVAPAMASCADGQKNQDETDVDCGGSCGPCALTKDCNVNADCASTFCDALAPHRCLADHCTDHHTDSDETDVDCGGSCPACQAFSSCSSNQDCQSGDCTSGNSAHCLPKTCSDGQLDSNETDLDCGGGVCDGCALGKKCGEPFDCQSGGCDALSFTCIADPCLDHRQDVSETDVDCGGADTCARCALGKKCKITSDCVAGATCSTNTGFSDVCQ